MLKKIILFLFVVFLGYSSFFASPAYAAPGCLCSLKRTQCEGADSICLLKEVKDKCVSVMQTDILYETQTIFGDDKQINGVSFGTQVTSQQDCNALLEKNKKFSVYPVVVTGECKISDCGVFPGQELVKALQIKKPILEIIIPNLKFTEVANTVDEQGNIQFPWIGEYIKAVYRFGVSIASILGVIMIIIEGVRIVISAGGEEKVAGYKHIGRICAGLCLAWFSYVILYNINSDLVSFQALKIKLADDTTEVDDGNYEMTADESRSLSTEFKSLFKNSTSTAGIDLATFDEPWWKNQRSPDSDPKVFTCAKYYADPAKYPPRGVVPTTAITEPYDCGGLLPSPIRTIPQMQEGICKVAQLAKNDGYKLSITSSYRPFKDQVTGYCPGQKDSASARASHAVPGYSNHGRGQAVDAKLSKDGRQLTGYDYWCQCLYDVNDWNRLADYFYQANPNFYRLNIESWHFEYRPQRGGSVYRDAQGHGHAIQCSKITPAQIASCQKKK
jgi:hypothetical protein